MTRTVIACVSICIATFCLGVVQSQCVKNVCAPIAAWEDDTQQGAFKCYGYDTYVQGGKTFQNVSCQWCPGDNKNKYCNTTGKPGQLCQPNTFLPANILEYTWGNCSSKCAGVPNNSIKETTPAGNTISTQQWFVYQCKAPGGS